MAEQTEDKNKRTKVGTVISIPEAIEAGRLVFGDVLKED